jgi:hypothetical protein
MQYMIRCQGPHGGDYIRTQGAFWTMYSTHRTKPHDPLLLIDTMGEAQGQLDEVAKALGNLMHTWTLTIEEYTE